MSLNANDKIVVNTNVNDSTVKVEVPQSAFFQAVNDRLIVLEGQTNITFKAGVADYASLPTVGNIKNDARITNDTGHLYIYDGTSWIDQGDILDLNWLAIQGKPSSAVADIDNAVSIKHTQNTDTALRTDKLVVAANGYVGIGLPVPGYLLHVDGNAMIQGIMHVGGTGTLQFVGGMYPTFKMEGSNLRLRRDDTLVKLLDVTPNGDIDANGNINATAYKVGGVAGASGTFLSSDTPAKTVTVINGLITSIV